MQLLEVFGPEPIRNRLMLALAYDSALRREELCSLRTDDVDPAHRTLRVRAETTKTRRERVVPYSASTGVLLGDYLRHRGTLSRARGPLFLSESRRNRAEPLTLWTWSKVVRRVALAADVPRFSTHTTRHLCLTDLARMGWELHAIATFAGHRSTESTLRYIHLSGRDLATKLNRSMTQLHAQRVAHAHRERGDHGVTRPLTAHAVPADVVPSDVLPSDAVPAVLAAGVCSGPASSTDALRCSRGRPRRCEALSPLQLRRNRARGIPRRTAGHWRALARLVEPLDAARAALHHGDDVRYRRAGAHAAAVILRHCAASGRAWWGWTAWDWAAVCGPSSQAFRAAQPLPTETTVRPFTIALGYLLGRFSDFQHLGNFNRLQLAQLVFGAEPIEEAMSQAGAVMDRWGYRSQTRDDGRYRLPGILAQALLINRSPRLADLTTAAFAALRAHPASSGRHPAALHALQTRGRRPRPLRPAGPARLQPRSRHRRHPPGAGPRGSSAGTTPPPSPPRSAPWSGPRWPRPDGGWPPSTPRSPNRASGPGRPARPGSPRSTG